MRNVSYRTLLPSLEHAACAVQSAPALLRSVSFRGVPLRCFGSG